jgi:hypothetical protein
MTKNLLSEPDLLHALFDVSYGPPPVTVARSRLNQILLPTSD